MRASSFEILAPCCFLLGPSSFFCSCYQPHTPTLIISTPYTRTASNGPSALLQAIELLTSLPITHFGHLRTAFRQFRQFRLHAPSCRSIEKATFSFVPRDDRRFRRFKRSLAVSGVFRLDSDLHFALTSRHSLRESIQRLTGLAGFGSLASRITRRPRPVHRPVCRMLRCSSINGIKWH